MVVLTSTFSVLCRKICASHCSLYPRTQPRDVDEDQPKRNCYWRCVFWSWISRCLLFLSTLPFKEIKYPLPKWRLLFPNLIKGNTVAQLTFQWLNFLIFTKCFKVLTYCVSLNCCENNCRGVCIGGVVCIFYVCMLCVICVVCMFYVCVWFMHALHVSFVYMLCVCVCCVVCLVCCMFLCVMCICVSHVVCVCK